MKSRTRHIAVLIIAWSIVPLTHGAAPDQGPHAVITVREDGYFLDSSPEPVEIEDPAAYCLECHGGPEGSSKETSPGPRADHLLGTADRNHPVDTPYPSGRRGYRSIEELDDRLVLDDGRITCLTCHEAGPERALVIPKERSKLCVSCHQR